MQNPISTPFTSIKLFFGNTDDSSDADGIELLAINTFCQFERMELEESTNNIFPVGSLIVRDTGDIVSYIAQREIKKIKVALNNNEKFTWYITSVTYVNNMASEIDQAFVAINFTNKLYYESQYVSFYDERQDYELNAETGELEPVGEAFPVWGIQYPFVTTPEHIIKTYAKKKVFTPPEFTITDSEGGEVSLNGCGVNLFIKNIAEPTNYVLFRPRISDAMRREQFQTNIITYLNYLFTYATDEFDRPYYMFWTDFTNCLNYKFFDLQTDLLADDFSFDKENTDPGHIQAYAIYDSADVERSLVIEGQERLCKKIYVMVTNPAYTIHDKNYYYIRSSPIYMEDTEGVPAGSTSDIERLMSPFLSESANTTLSTVTSYTINDSPGLTYSRRVSAIEDSNLYHLPDKGFFGYSKDYNDTRFKINSVDATASYENILNNIETTPLGLRDSYNPTLPQTPLYAFNDNPYMWQFQYDMTTTHPNIERGLSGSTVVVTKKDFYEEISEILNSTSGGENSSDVSDLLIDNLLAQVSLNKVLAAKYEAMKEKSFYDNERRVLLEKTEKENFVANVLCCIGTDLAPKEDWFFAKITGFIQDKRQLFKDNGEPAIYPLANAWLYSWKMLQPGPYIAGFTGGNTANIPIDAANHNMFQGWTASQCIGSTGSPSTQDIQSLSRNKGFTGIETWAVNLNERMNAFYDGSAPVSPYRGPGYNINNIESIGSFSVKPVGFTGTFYTEDNLSGSANHIVKMYKIPIKNLRDMGAATPAPNLDNEYVYYFAVENAVDGACNA
jgi:hypothetical protein